MIRYETDFFYLLASGYTQNDKLKNIYYVQLFLIVDNLKDMRSDHKIAR